MDAFREAEEHAARHEHGQDLARQRAQRREQRPQQDDDDEAPARPDAFAQRRQEDIRDAEAAVEKAHE